MQLDDPDVPWYFPEGQLVQALAPEAANLPAGHGVHADAPAVENVPGEQLPVAAASPELKQ